MRLVTSIVLTLTLSTLLELAGCKRPQLQKTCEVNEVRMANESWTRFINVLVPNNDTYGFSRSKIEPAVTLAVNERLRVWFKRGDIVVRFLDTACDPVGAPVKAGLEYYHHKKADLFIGPVCSVSLIPIALYNYKWKVPVISPGGIFVTPRDEQQAARMSAANTILLSNIQTVAVANFLLEIFKVQNWKKFVFLYDWDGPAWAETIYCQLMKRAVLAETHGMGFVTVYESFRNVADAVEKAEVHVSTKYSIVTLCGDPDDMREILIQLYQKGFGNGEYLFLILDLHSSDYRARREWYREDDPPAKNELSRHAFRNVWIIGSVRKTSEKLGKLVNITLSEYKKVVSKDVDVQEMWNYIAPFYDSIILYSDALNATLRLHNISAGERSPDVRVPENLNLHITSYLKNRTLNGISGPIHLDANGTRTTVYQLLTPSIGNQFLPVALFHSDTRKLFLLNSSHDWANGNRIADTPICGFDNSRCQTFVPAPEWVLIMIAVGFSISIALPFGARYITLKRKSLSEMEWRIRWDELGTVCMAKHANSEYFASALGLQPIAMESSSATVNINSISTGMQRIDTRETLRRISTVTKLTDKEKEIELAMAVYKATPVSLRPITLSKIDINTTLIREICRLKELHCDHLCRFVGLCADVPNACVVYEHCPRGTLRDILQKESIKLNWLFQLSFLQDIVSGMQYLHSNYGPHGNLTSSSCVVDNHFVVKISDFGFRMLFRRKVIASPAVASLNHRSARVSHSDSITRSLKRNKSSLTGRDSGGMDDWQNCVYLAPEHLRNYKSQPTNEGDVYSFGIIFQEVIYRKGPFYIAEKKMTAEEILVKLCGNPNSSGDESSVPFRPTINLLDVTQLVHDAAASKLIVGLMSRCWAELASDRPTFHALHAALRKLPSGDIDAMDNLLRRMSQYTNNLEALIEERTQDYVIEKEKAEQLLYAILPRSVALQLIRNETIRAESYDSVTIYLSDICGFTQLAADSSAMDVIMMLNDLYTLFDSTIILFDVYKIETIGDAYMVVSGLPERNGDVHAREVARLALRIVETMQAFKIRHKPNSACRVRIGVHTGPVCAGVVGLKMPRFCLFGGTVTIASRMENTGSPMRVHVSDFTKRILDTFHLFELEPGEDVDVHSGVLKTWWLLREREPA